MAEIALEFRPSNAHRWLVCHAQPRAVVGMPDRPSKYAERGTVAHALLEMALRLDYAEEELDRFEDKLLKGEGIPAIEVDEKMIRGVGHAMDYTRSFTTRNHGSDYHLEYETSVRIGDYDVPGHADIILDHLPHEIAVVDYKDGVVGVDEEENPQLTLYLLGYIQEHRKRLHKDTVFRLVIVQPNAQDNRPPVRETVVSYEFLKAFRTKALAALHAAHDPTSPRVAGHHCRFCAAAGQCKTYAEYVLQEASIEFSEEGLMANREAEDLTPEEHALILAGIPRIQAWVLSVQERAIERMLCGEKLPGYKVVGSRPQRKWDDEEQVIKLLVRRKLNLNTYAPRSPLSPAKLEKTTKGKKATLKPEVFQAISKRITHNPVEPRVAPIEDKRRPWIPGSEFVEDE